MKKGYFLLVLILVIVLLTVGCGTKSSTTTSAPAQTSSATTQTSNATTQASTTVASSTAAQQYGGTLRFVRNMGIAVLGAPQDMPTFSYYNILISPAIEPLVIADAQGNPLPWLAKKIDISADGKTITFTLNQGIKFHDGTDFNAEAVKYNLEADVTANVSGSDVLKSITAYEIPDPYTIVFKLNQYDARILPGLANGTIGQIASPTALKKPASGDDIAKTHIVGTGPFKFGSWQRDQFVKYVKNENYWQKGKPYVDAIEMLNNADVTTSIMSLKAGEVNWVENIDPSDFINLQKEGYTTEIADESFYIFSLFLDSANADSPFSKLKVRQAVEYAIDREGMAQGIGMGTVFPIYQHGAEKDPWFSKDQPKLKYDPDKAKQLLTEAGYPNGFTIPLTSDVRVRKDFLVAIQSYLEAVGIKTTLDMADVPRFTDLTKNGWKGILVPGFPNADTFTGWIGLYTNPIFTYPSMTKPAGYSTDWKAVIAEPDLNKRIALMRAAQKKIYDDSLIITYVGDAPRSVTDGTVMDKGFYKNGLIGYFEPSNIWLKKK
jgi:peptide/nickel transport system substrate-binding protein